MRWGISCGELNGLNAARLAGMETPLQIAPGEFSQLSSGQLSKLTILIVGFCSAVWIVKP